jgi:hypothetical protein
VIRENALALPLPFTVHSFIKKQQTMKSFKSLALVFAAAVISLGAFAQGSAAKQESKAPAKTEAKKDAKAPAKTEAKKDAKAPAKTEAKKEVKK